MENERIKLAEAMGWKKAEGNGGAVGMYDYWIDPEGDDHGKSRFDGSPAFDPFNSVSDDYAVLEWVRQLHADYQLTDGSGFDFSWHFYRSFDGVTMCNYDIGDFARAAVIVLQQRSQG